MIASPALLRSGATVALPVVSAGLLWYAFPADSLVKVLVACVPAVAGIAAGQLQRGLDAAIATREAASLSTLPRVGLVRERLDALRRKLHRAVLWLAFVTMAGTAFVALEPKIPYRVSIGLVILGLFTYFVLEGHRVSERLVQMRFDLGDRMREDALARVAS